MMPETNPIETLLEAALPHVAFDGWTEAAFIVAAEDAGMTLEEAKGHCPRGGLDLAVACHKRGDTEMAARLAALDLSEMRYRDKVARAVWLRLAVNDDKEIVRRASVLFALPQNAPEGARLIWETSGAIWSALGDSSEDINWYTKRATLSGVYGSCVLFWLGDDSEDHEATRAFIDRRIDDVMNIERAKAQINQNPLLSKLLAPAFGLMEKVKAPQTSDRSDLPGHWTPSE